MGCHLIVTKTVGIDIKLLLTSNGPFFFFIYFFLSEVRFLLLNL